jgi:hypothetical protein
MDCQIRSIVFLAERNMISLCFYLERQDVEDDGSKRIRVHKWNTLAVAFGVDKLIMIDPGKGDTFQGRDLANVESHYTLASVIAAYPNSNHVFADDVDGTGTRIEDYTWPPLSEDTIIFIGRNSRGFRGDDVDVPGDRISIPVVVELWADQAALLFIANRERRAV